MSLFALALTVRAVVAAFVYVRFDGTLFLDDATYSDLAAQKAAGDTTAWDAYTYFLYERTATMLLPMTWLYQVFGPVRLVGQLLVACLGAGTAVVAAMLAHRAAGRTAAIVVGLGLALMPSQVLFSATTMKDAFVWFLLAWLGLLVAQASDARGRRLALLGVLCFLALLLLGYLRLHTQVVAVLAFVLCALLLRPSVARRWVVVGALLIGLAAPWIAGSGPGGTRLLTSGADATYLAGLREAQAVGGSALDVAPERAEDALAADEAPAEASRPEEPIVEKAPPAPVGEETGSATLSYLPRGIVAVLLGPAPWQSGSGAFRVAGLENLLWYALLVLAAIGAPRAWRARSATMFPVLAAGGLLVMWALVEGNAGTAFRHRGEFVWVGWLLAGLGLATLLDRRSARRSASSDTVPPGPHRSADVVGAGSRRSAG